MENIAEKLNLVIEYIERHLSETIDSKMIEKIACCSYYDVGRIFSLIADIKLSDYVRKRRLTQAGAELKYDHAKVMDVALKYGYDSPVSFARAFQAFHGFNPSEATKDGTVLKVFPRLVYQICVKKVQDAVRKEKMTVNGKEYEASCFGEQDMSARSPVYSRRKYWRLENAYEDFKDAPRQDRLLPFANYPPICIEEGQIFVIDYYKKDGEVERKYYLADGTIWKDMPCTREFLLDYLQPIRKDTLCVGGKEYEASYFGEQDMSLWYDHILKREYWRLENVSGIPEGGEPIDDSLPYNNYPPVKIEEGQVFVIDYRMRDGTAERKYYLADGSAFCGMPSTRQFIVRE